MDRAASRWTRTGKIYVTNYYGNTLMTFTASGKPTTPTISGLGTPFGVAVDAAGKIYVINHSPQKLLTFTAKGAPTTPTITTLSEPWGVAIH